MVHAMEYKNKDNLQFPLPKIIVVVVVAEDDILKAFAGETHGLSRPFSRVINHIMTEHSRNIASFKEFLPAKCHKVNYPQILWIQLPEHDSFHNNDERYKFNKCLDEVSRLHPNVSTLALKKVWNAKNTNLFLEHSQRFTVEGLSVYWEAIDRTVRYFDSIVLKKQAESKKKPHHAVQSHTSGNTSMTGQNDQYKNKFKWKNPSIQRTSELPRFTRLPPPPALNNN